MSKGSLFWANARGKLGESVFYRAGGEQRNRTYVKRIKNPKTVAQAYNRLSMLNFSSGFRALKPLIQVSFPNRLSNESGFNAFVKANKSAYSPVIDRTSAMEGLAVLGDMAIADGNISILGSHKLTRGYYVGGLDGDNSFAMIGYDVAGIESKYGSKEYPEFTTAWNLLAEKAAGNTFARIETIDEFKALLTVCGLPLDTVIVVAHGSYEDIGYRYEYSRYSVESLQIVPGNTLEIASKRFENDDLTDNWNTVLGIWQQETDNDNDYYGTVIAFKQGGKLDVTPTRMITAGLKDDLVKQFQRGGFVYDQILADYAPSQGNLLTV